MTHLRTTATLTAAAALLVCVTNDAAGQEQQRPTVCEDEAAFRAFDFWIGEWDVYNNANGNLAGRNRIESQESGCVLVERWTSASGGTGMSVNYYDIVTDQWRQVWIANGYSIDITGGLDESGAMVLVGEIHTYAQRRALPFRGTWTPNADGSVRQFFEQQDPATGEWQVWFDGRYEPRH
jgi:hypothetical protein